MISNSDIGRSGLSEKNARRYLLLLQVGFFLIGLVDLDAPFTSMHHERQNQTFDIARHVFAQGWQAVLLPRTSFSWYDDPAQPFTVAHLEVPFHGIIGWPFARLLGHERAIVRLISLAFALVSVQLMYSVLRHWLEPTSAAIGAALWITAPLVLHLGQSPMPDILCTTGMLSAYLFALRGRTMVSSACFLFAILAKPSVVVFGLPVLVALLVAKLRDSKGKDSLRPRPPSDAAPIAGKALVRALLGTSFAWGLIPLLGLAAWISVEITHPDIAWTVLKCWAEKRDLSAGFFMTVVACLIPFGVGLLGSIGLVLAAWRAERIMNPSIKWAILISVLVYLATVVRKIPEPQYFLPLLPWAVLGASFGLDALVVQFSRVTPARKTLFYVAIAVHVVVAGYFACDLKASRVPDFKEIEQVRRILPGDARVIVVYRHIGASAAIWLDRNVIAVLSAEMLDAWLPRLQEAGFTHILLLDMESRHGHYAADGLKAVMARFFRIPGNRSNTDLPKLTDFAQSGSASRTFCDQRFRNVFESPHLALFVLRP